MSARQVTVQALMAAMSWWNSLPREQQATLKETAKMPLRAADEITRYWLSIDSPEPVPHPDFIYQPPTEHSPMNMSQHPIAVSAQQRIARLHRTIEAAQNQPAGSRSLVTGLLEMVFYQQMQIERLDKVAQTLATRLGAPWPELQVPGVMDDDVDDQPEDDSEASALAELHPILLGMEPGDMDYLEAIDDLMTDPLLTKYAPLAPGSPEEFIAKWSLPDPVLVHEPCREKRALAVYHEKRQAPDVNALMLAYDFVSALQHNQEVSLLAAMDILFKHVDEVRA